ncbi:hypothetical protein EKH57_14810 [Halorubrum sp. BOL3-1]|uniref:hypothetical protein n=1 Tax=Halorubrum sp. BOL3-1 TaxID=2497325 RepID=UPI0010051786|nr:hypothetical protein [Halorubrum sp. BOL3-1]QAU13887.1 hypothetical protein EKH57_14810 [Halorubrum sp. BOL3-1]
MTRDNAPERDDADAEPDGRRDADRSSRRASRRGVLAVGVTGLLAGCLVTSEEEAVDGDATRQTDDGEAGNDDSDAGDDGSDGNGGSDDADETTPDEVGPDGSGLIVTDTTVLNVTESGGRTRVEARLTVENAGRFDYGFVKLRVDAYATPAGSDEREAVGFGDATRRFPSDDRFDGSDSRTFDVTIRFESGETSVRPDPDRYVVDAAVRRAEPL